MRVSVNTVLAFCIRSYIKHCRTFSFMLCQLETNHDLSPEGRGEGRILVISSQACISTVILSTTRHLSFGEALKTQKKSSIGQLVTSWANKLTDLWLKGLSY